MKKETTWGSKNAEDLYQIATTLGGFDRFELMMEIQRRVKNRDSRVNAHTVEEALGTVSRRYSK